jgi:Domain of unknown function (DUF4124)
MSRCRRCSTPETGPASLSHLVRYAICATRAIRVPLFAAAIALASAAHADDIYKCVDPSGRITYQADPCTNGRAIDIAPGQFNPDAAQRLREDAAAWNARQDMLRAAQAQAQAQADADARAARAEAARQQATAAAANDSSGCSYCSDWNGAVFWPGPPWVPSPKPPRPPRPPPRPPSYIVVR